MASRMRWGSLSTFAKFLGFLVAVGLAAQLNSGPIDLAYRALYGLFLLCGSIAVLVRGWRGRDNPEDLSGALDGGQLSALPPKWRRWVLGMTIVVVEAVR